MRIRAAEQNGYGGDHDEAAVAGVPALPEQDRGAAAPAGQRAPGGDRKIALRASSETTIGTITTRVVRSGRSATFATATLVQEADAYLAWAGRHADMLTQPTYVTLQRAFAEAFPCPK